MVKSCQWTLTLCLGLLLMKCDKNILSPEEGLLYFPTQVGNFWVYQIDPSGTCQKKVEIIDTLRIGSYKYYLFEYQITGTNGSVFRDSSYYRITPDNKLFVNYDGEDVLYIDFNGEVGSQWSTFGDYKAKISQKGLMKEVPAGTFPDAMQIFFDIPYAVDDEFMEIYAPRLGLIEVSGAWVHYELVQAKIGRTSYP